MISAGAKGVKAERQTSLSRKPSWPFVSGMIHRRLRWLTPRSRRVYQGYDFFSPGSRIFTPRRLEFILARYGTPVV